jgi:hypothetical protein
MLLFDDIERSDNSPAAYAEPEFSFLNRSARPAFGRIRHVLDDWFSRYSPEGRSDLCERFRSDIDAQHRGAFFELLLHELLLRLGCEVQLHPELGESSGQGPDFLVKSPTCGQFFTEAVVATDESDQKAAARARMNQVYDALNRMQSPDFFIGMELTGEPVTPPSAECMRSFLQKHLAGLNPDEMAARLEAQGPSGLPRWRYEHDGLTVDFYPIPRPPESRGKPGVRPTTRRLRMPERDKSREAIRQAILKKAGRYGELEHPYVIAVNALGKAVDDTDIFEALPFREPDGVWTSPRGPRYTRVSAVLIAVRLLPWNIPRADACLYHNPWAQRAYTCELARLPQAVPEGTRMTRSEGESLATLLGLSAEWPEQ